jgi:hypothetical protein
VARDALPPLCSPRGKTRPTPHSYAEILARELPSAQLAELTPKVEDEGRHAADAQTGIAEFLGRVFLSAAQEEATRNEAAGR